LPNKLSVDRSDQVILFIIWTKTKPIIYPKTWLFVGAHQMLTSAEFILSEAEGLSTSRFRILTFHSLGRFNMFQIKFAICLASYSMAYRPASYGSATENSELRWLGKTDWVDEFDEAEIFSEELAAESAMLREQIHGIDIRSLSIVKVLWNDYWDAEE
jgi:hypothetical protein